MKVYLFIAMTILLHIHIQAEQFLYPVTDFDNENKLVIIHQKSLDDVEVWFFDQETKTIEKGLSSFLIPANLRILPTKDGFSFIDQGFIKIKQFNKRSPKTISVYEPISLISAMNWIDDHTFYFTAREGDYYQTFQGNTESNIQRLSSEPIDFLYPSKIDDIFYCIKRTPDQQFKITMQSWNPIEFDQSQILPENVIVPLTDEALCFLKMITHKEGFYLQISELQSNQDDSLYTFSCHHLIKIENEQWISQKLFDFIIPKKYINGSSRLYESMELFLPNYSIKDYIYYVSFNQDHNIFELFKFHISTQSKIDITDNFMQKNEINHNQLFAPYILNSKIYCGIIAQDLPIDIFMQNNFNINLPSVNTK